MLTDGQFNIAGVSSEERGKGRRNEFRLPMHLPQYASRKRLEQMVQGKVGGRIEERQGWEAPALWKEQSKKILEGLPEVQALREGVEQDPKDIWFDVDWTEESSNKTKKKQKAGDWWETDDC
tara:strand:- start:31157 stop:31522 length:366 start_codon:yes stop_codon:yes gene_type:complete